MSPLQQAAIFLKQAADMLETHEDTGGAFGLISAALLTLSEGGYGTQLE